MAIDGKSVEYRLKNIRTLRTLPGVVKQICLMAESDDISSAELGRMISKDAVITGRVLRLVNSSFYGFPNRISTVTQALVMLGFTVVKGLLLSISIVEYMTDSIVGLWEHSLGVSIASGLIAKHIGEPDPEEAQVTGLLHDLGKVVIALEFRQEYEEIRRLVEEEGLSFYKAERKVLVNITHMDINGFLAREWNLPGRLCDALTQYHRPHNAISGKRIATIVHLGNALVKAADFGFAGDRVMAVVDEKLVRSLGLSDFELKEIVAKLVFELDNLDIAELTE